MTTQVSSFSFDTTTQAAVNKPRISSIIYTYSDFNTVYPVKAVSQVGGFIKILGSGFTTGEQVFIRSAGSKGATLAPSVVYVSSTQLNCTMPASTVGSKMLYVVNLDGATAIVPITYQFIL
jgi:hypothetical protein